VRQIADCFNRETNGPSIAVDLINRRVPIKVLLHSDRSDQLGKQAPMNRPVMKP
jgi:hypothetical protein